MMVVQRKREIMVTRTLSQRTSVIAICNNSSQQECNDACRCNATNHRPIGTAAAMQSGTDY